MSTTSKSSRSRACGLLIGVAVGLASFSPAIAQDRTAMRSVDAVPQWIEELKLQAPETIDLAGVRSPLQKLSPGLMDASGRVQVIVRLGGPSVAELDDDRPGARMGHKYKLMGDQDSLLARLSAAAPDMKVIARTQLVLNAVFVEMDATQLPNLASDPDVARIAPVGDYELALSNTVPYIGATAVQGAGFDGSGVKVAILDSGIDYTHRNMGGEGTLAAYLAAYGDPTFPPAAVDLHTTRDGLFPTEKVVDGYDFVGEVWPFGPLAPDPDPIDYEGHGSHVADITGGVGGDNGGPSNGVAPGVDLYAVKVCSAVSSSCSGVALIQGMEFSVDPNGDGDPSDRVDIINMSLGATYGQAFDDDLSAAVDNASALGVLTVSSAGNCGDSPFCTGTPSSAPTALSVAQTELSPAQQIVVNGTSVAGVYQTWSAPLGGPISGELQYADGAGGNLNGCAPFAADSLTDKVVLVDRGGCFFTTKIFNIGNAGGAVGIIGLVAPGAPFAGGFGDPGGPIIAPGYMISQADSNALKALVGATASVDPASDPAFISGFTRSSTARGPEMSFNLLKPEIGAPGTSVSLTVGTGDGESGFGGTSGASPMAAGAAALLQDACRDDGDSDSDGCSPLALKALIMNNGNRDIASDTTGAPAEVTRIGGGEVQVDQSLGAPFWAYSPDDDQPSISLGLVDGAKDLTIKRKVRIINLSRKVQRIDVIPTFRLANGAASDAITVDTRSRVTIGKGGKATLNVKFHIDADMLRANAMNSGSQGNSPANLGVNEIGGYLVLKSSDGEIALPWHVLARQAADVSADTQQLAGGGFPETVGLFNAGVGTAQNDTYALIGVSDEKPRGDKGAQTPMPDLRAVGVNTFIVPPGFCSSQFLWVFAINTWDRQTHLVPVSHQVAIDIGKDGIFEYVILNRDLTFNNVTDGRQVSWVFDLAAGSAGAFFFAEHSTNTGNTALIVCGEQLGLTAADILATNVGVEVFSQDFYYGGPGDLIDGITITPLGEQYFGLTSDIPGGGAGALDVFDFGPFPGNSPELGVLMFTNGDRGTGNRGAATADTEAMLFMAPGAMPPMALPNDDDEDSD